MFKKPCSREEVSGFNAWNNCAIDHRCNWNDGDILYSELEVLLQRESSSAIAVYCVGRLKLAIISNLIKRTVTDVTQLGYPQLAELPFPAVSCTFACHNKSRYFCAMISAFALVRWLHFYIMSLQCARCPTQHNCHWHFPDVNVTVTSLPTEQGENKVR
jgi:hypothetical protein